jgi:hypothetical protein
MKLQPPTKDIIMEPFLAEIRIYNFSAPVADRRHEAWIQLICEPTAC